MRAKEHFILIVILSMLACCSQEPAADRDLGIREAEYVAAACQDKRPTLFRGIGEEGRIDYSTDGFVVVPAGRAIQPAWFEAAYFIQGKWRLSAPLKKALLPGCLQKSERLTTSQLLVAFGCSKEKLICPPKSAAPREKEKARSQRIQSSSYVNLLPFQLGSMEAFDNKTVFSTPTEKLKIRDQDAAWTWTACNDSMRAYHLTAMDDAGKMICEDKIDSLYSWGPMAKIEWLKDQPWSGWLKRDGKIAPVFSSQSPIASFGYGDYAIRIQLRQGVKFQFVDRGDPYQLCPTLTESEAQRTIIVRFWQGRTYTGLDYILCSKGPIASWSYGGNAFFAEMERDLEWIKTHNYKNYELYVKKGGVDILFPRRLDGHPFDRDQLKNNLSEASQLDGAIFVNPLESFTQSSEHYQTRTPNYFNPGIHIQDEPRIEVAEGNQRQVTNNENETDDNKPHPWVWFYAREPRSAGLLERCLSQIEARYPEIYCFKDKNDFGIGASCFSRAAYGPRELEKRARAFSCVESASQWSYPSQDIDWFSNHRFRPLPDPLTKEGLQTLNPFYHGDRWYTVYPMDDSRKKTCQDQIEATYPNMICFKNKTTGLSCWDRDSILVTSMLKNLQMIPCARSVSNYNRPRDEIDWYSNPRLRPSFPDLEVSKKDDSEGNWFEVHVLEDNGLERKRKTCINRMHEKYPSLSCFQFGDDVNRIFCREKKGFNKEAIKKSLQLLNCTARVDLAGRPQLVEPEFSLHWSFIKIFPGTFTMGSPPEEEGRFQNEVRHSVTITKEFEMQATPVTQLLWKRILGKDPSYFEGPRFPVENVAWNDVREFINRLNLIQEGQGFRYRLPTEAEWEYAARGGKESAYWFGNDAEQLGDFAWFKKNSSLRTHLVGTKKPNPFGLYDMYGNVWQWVSDDYQPNLGTSPVENPSIRAGELKVIRGGSWHSGARLVRSACRNSVSSHVHFPDLGFRLVRVPTTDAGGH